MTPLLAAIIIYLVAQFAIGAWVTRRIHNEADYLVAGRKLGYPLTTFSIFATWFGAETVIGSAGRVASQGLSWNSAEPFGYALCLMLMGLIFAAPLRRRGLTTLADLFRMRYSVPVERIAALILIPGSVLWAAAQIRAFGYVLNTSSTFSLELAMGMATVVVILYTAFGGLWADAVTDLVQGLMLILGLVVLLGAVVMHFGGINETITAVTTPRATRLTTPIPFWHTAEAWAIPVLGSLIATETVGRIVGTRSEQVARRSSIMAGFMYLTVGLIPVLFGLASAPFMDGLGDPEQLIPAMALKLLPGVLYALFAGAIISAILSTVDSTLLMASGLMSHNLIVPVFRVIDEKKKVLIARVGVLCFGIIAYGLAREAGGVFELVETASAFGSAGVLVTVSFALFTQMGGPRTALATLIMGVLSYLAANVAEYPYPFLTSLLVSVITYLTGSLLIRAGKRARPGVINTA